MNDKNGKELRIGDSVKIFTYTRAMIIGFRNNDGDELAVTKEKTGESAVYSEEIRLVSHKAPHDRTVLQVAPDSGK